MAALQVFEVEEVDGTQYVTTESRGTVYTLAKCGDAWGVYTRRKSLGRWNMGGYRHFDTLADVAANCKAFADFYAMEAA